MAPEGESPVDVEKRAVPIIYDYILNRSENAILFVGNFFDSVHGRLLRIILSSLIFKNLAHMSDFTHFNTCINLVDVIIESDHSLFLADPLRGRIMTTNAKVNLDDNVTLKDAQLIISESKTRPALEISTILHPESVSFCPLLLDDRSHLPVKMQSN